MTAAHRDKIARDISGDWESLATFIGVPREEVEDIKDEYRKPLDRRLAMMRTWYKLLGKEATYVKLVEGLRQIGRRDLIDCLMRRESPSKHDSSGVQYNTLRSLKHTICSKELSLCSSVVLFVMMIFTILYLAEVKVEKARNYDVTSTETNNHTSYDIGRAKSADHSRSPLKTALLYQRAIYL